MKIELVEFHPSPALLQGKPFINRKGVSIGSVHIYVIDFDMDIRGIQLFYTFNEKIVCQIPYGSGIDQETKRKVFFPYISFTDRKTFDQLLDLVNQVVNEIALEFSKQKISKNLLMEYKKKFYERKNSKKMPCKKK